jgi:hypothetical protein
MSAPASVNPDKTPVIQDASCTTRRDLLQAGRQEVARWHGVANAASIALFGVSVIDTTSAARAAWWEVSKFVLGLSENPRTPRKPTHKA